MSEPIRFRLAGNQNPLILVPVTVNGRGPYQFILDTGSSHCLLSQETASALEILPQSERKALGAGGQVTFGMARVASIELGAAKKENVQVAITEELTRIGAAVGSRIDGDIGFDFLQDLRLRIDYEEELLFLNAGIVPAVTSLSFELAAASKPLIVVPVWIEGQGPFQCALDTGCSRTILSAALAGKLGVATAGGDWGTGGGGRVQVLDGIVKSLSIGAASVSDHAIGVGGFLEMLSGAIGRQLDGIVGYNFLRQFAVTIDYPRRVLELAPRHNLAYQASSGLAATAITRAAVPKNVPNGSS